MCQTDVTCAGTELGFFFLSANSINLTFDQCSKDENKLSPVFVQYLLFDGELVFENSSSFHCGIGLSKMFKFPLGWSFASMSFLNFQGRGAASHTHCISVIRNGTFLNVLFYPTLRNMEILFQIQPNRVIPCCFAFFVKSVLHTNESIAWFNWSINIQ